MIKIPISEKQKENIEKIYWDWMSKHHLEKFKSIIENDSALKKLIAKTNETLDVSIKKYLLSNYSNLEKVKIEIDKMRKSLYLSAHSAL